MKMIKSMTTVFVVAVLLLSISSKGFISSYPTTTSSSHHPISYIDPEPMKP